MTLQLSHIHHNTPSAVSLLHSALTWDILSGTSAAALWELQNLSCSYTNQRITWACCGTAQSNVTPRIPHAEHMNEWHKGAPLLLNVSYTVKLWGPSCCFISNKHFARRHTQRCTWDILTGCTSSKVYPLSCGPVLPMRLFKGFSRPLCTSTKPPLDNYWATGTLQPRVARSFPAAADHWPQTEPCCQKTTNGWSAAHPQRKLANLYYISESSPLHEYHAVQHV